MCRATHTHTQQRSYMRSKQHKIKIRFIVMHTYEICPPLLTHPGRHLLTHTCTGSHTYRDRCHTLERWAAIHSAQGAWGYSALLKGTSDMTRRWTATPPAVSGSGDRTANLQVIGRPTLTTEPRLPTEYVYINSFQIYGAGNVFWVSWLRQLLVNCL